MKSTPLGSPTGFSLLGCLLVVLVLALGCTCKPATDDSPPTDTPSATSISSPTPGKPTSVPREVAELEVDTSLLTDNPCRVPCWHNIIPGESNVDHVRAQLEDNPTVRQSTLGYELTEEVGVPIGLFGWLAKGELWNRIVFHNETVVRMEIFVDHDWTLGEAVDKFGSPKYVVSYTYDGHEGDGFAVVVYYPDQGLKFHSSTYPYKRDKYGNTRITRNLKVTMGVYFAPTTMEGMLSEAYLCSPEKMEDCRPDDIREWEGFED